MLNEIGTNTNSPLLSIQLLKQCPKVCIATKMNSHLRFFSFFKLTMNLFVYYCLSACMFRSMKNNIFTFLVHFLNFAKHRLHASLSSFFP